jgi:hypothetical protein
VLVAQYADPNHQLDRGDQMMAEKGNTAVMVYVPFHGVD